MEVERTNEAENWIRLFNLPPVMSHKRVAQALDCSVPTIYRLVDQEPDFPRPVEVSRGRSGFRTVEFVEYMISRPLAERRSMKKEAK